MPDDDKPHEEQKRTVLPFEKPDNKKRGPNGHAGEIIAYQTGKKGALRVNTFNALAMLENERELRDLVAYDEMDAMTMVMAPIPDPFMRSAQQGAFQPRPLTDADTVLIQAYMQRQGLVMVSDGVVYKALLTHARARAFHPVRDWLERLRWDGKERLEHWLPDCLDAPDSNYSRAIGTFFLIGMVARIMRPGCKADYMLIFEGPQGLLKSMACRVLAGRYFSDSMPPLSDKDAMQHLAGKWLIELAELDALKEAALSRLKAFLTRQTDRFRPVYGRSEVVQNRCSMFVGTTNERAYLRDQSGNRRFWPIPCGQPNIEILHKNREQLFAEAFTRFHRGERWWPDRELEQALIAPEQEQRREVDPWEPIIAKWLNAELLIKISAAEIADLCLKIPHERFNQAVSRRIGHVLDRIPNWQRARSGHGFNWKRKVKE